MPKQLTTVEKQVLAELLVCGNVSGGELAQASAVSQDGLEMLVQTLEKLKEKGVLQQTLYTGIA